MLFFKLINNENSPLAQCFILFLSLSLPHMWRWEVLCFWTINENKNCTGSGVCIIFLWSPFWISIYATSLSPSPPLTHSFRIYKFFLSCFAWSNIWEANKTRGEKKWSRKLKLTSMEVEFIIYMKRNISSPCEHLN